MVCMRKRESISSGGLWKLLETLQTSDTQATGNLFFLYVKLMSDRLKGFYIEPRLAVAVRGGGSCNGPPFSPAAKGPTWASISLTVRAFFLFVLIVAKRKCKTQTTTVFCGDESNAATRFFFIFL